MVSFGRARGRVGTARVSNVFTKASLATFSLQRPCEWQAVSSLLHHSDFTQQNRSRKSSNWYANLAQVVRTSDTWMSCFVFFHNNSIIGLPGGKAPLYDWTVCHNCGYRNTCASCHQKSRLTLFPVHFTKPPRLLRTDGVYCGSQNTPYSAVVFCCLAPQCLRLFNYRRRGLHMERKVRKTVHF